MNPDDVRRYIEATGEALRAANALIERQAATIADQARALDKLRRIIEHEKAQRDAEKTRSQ